MAEWEREGSPIPSGPTPATLGRLTLMKRKGGGDVQTIPLDAERITFGRDYDCDVRLYYSDVSKLHCEIIFDIISGKAILHVKGTNGLLHTPCGGSASTYKPPSEIPLSDKDIITIRKKPFRFDYGASTESLIPFSPAIHSSNHTEVAPSPAKQPSFGSPSQPIRRRASHRLSLVPEGKTFVPLSPMKSSRNSTLGLGGMKQTPAKLNNKSKLSEQIPQEEEEEEEEEQIEEPVLDVAHGDEGDKVYLEVNEDENKENDEPNHVTKRIHDNPFMTPQQTRKAPIRNTSAVPRTRKMATIKAEEPSPVEQKVSTSPVSKDAPAPATPPKTPRSVPLPTTGETPYNPPTTPAPQEATTPVPARVALSTPKGPATLRKALLLRSARKVWQESRSSGVEGAIQVGAVETRRKSTSPKNRSGRKSNTPIPESPVNEKELDEDEDMSEESEEEMEEPDKHDEGALQWIQEDGSAEVSFESNSSGHDSLEADMSLDIPGQSVIEFATNNPDVEEEYINNDNAPVYDEEDDEEMELEEEVEAYEKYEQAVNLPEDESVEEVPVEDLHNEEEEEAEEDEAMSLAGTPNIRQPPSKQFFTPQPERNIHKLPRRSLASIGGPPVRFERLPATPNSFKRERAPPGSMGKPSRRVTMAVPEYEAEVEAKEEIVEPVVRKMVFATPVKSEAARAEAKRRRESLATPRQLPAPPASGFKDPIIETRFTDLIRNSVHPALLPESPEPSTQEVIPSTPRNDIKARLDKMRQQSIQRADRRATVGFVLPSTPSRPEYKQSESWSVNPIRIDVKGKGKNGPKTPIFPRLQKVPQIVESPEMKSKSEEDIMKSETKVEDKRSSPEFETPSSPSTPIYTGLKEMLNQPNLPSKTPDMSGLKALFPPTPKEIASPSLVGVKEMLKEPTFPATPNFRGMKDMFRQPKVAQTPKFDGIGEMFEEEEEEEEEVEEIEDEEEEEEIEEIEAAEDVVAVFEESEKENKDQDDDENDNGDDSLDVIGDDTLDVIEVQPEVKTVAVVAVKQSTSTKSQVTSKLPRPATITTASTSSSAPSRSRRAIPAPSQIPTSASTSAPKATSKIPARRGATATKVVEPAMEEPKSKSSRGKKAEPSTVVEVVEEPKSRSTRAKRTTSVEPESSTTASKSTTSKSRSTRAKSAVNEPEEVIENVENPGKATIPTKNKSTSSRPTRQATAEVEVEKEVSKPSRGKKPLTALPSQPTHEDKKSTSSSTKTKLPTATKKAITKVGEDKSSTTTSTSAPSRRKATIGNKENDESAIVEKPITTKKRVTSAASQKKDEGKSGVPVPVGRATRSRK